MLNVFVYPATQLWRDFTRRLFLFRRASGTHDRCICHWRRDPLSHPVLQNMTPTELGDLHFDATAIKAGPDAKTGSLVPTCSQNASRSGLLKSFEQAGHA